MIVELVQTAELPYPRVFDLLPSPALGTVLMLVAFALVLVSALLRRTRLDATAVALFTAGCFTHYYAVTDEVAVNLEHAWNLFHFQRFSMSPVQSLDGTIEVAFYLLHTPFAARLDHLILANYALALLSSVACVLLLYSTFRTVRGCEHRTWIFLLLAFPLVRTQANGFGAAFYCLFLVAGLTFALRMKESATRAFAVSLPLLRPESVLWSLYLTLTQAGAARSIPRLCGHIALVALSAASFYALFYLYYGHVTPTPVVNKTVSIAGYLNMFSEPDFLAHVEAFVKSGGAVLLLVATALVLSGSRALPAVQRRVLLAGLALALFYFVYYLIGAGTIGWYGNHDSRYFAPSVAFSVLAMLSVCAAIDPGLAARILTGTALVIALPASAAVVTGSQVAGDWWLNRQWAVRAGYIAEQLSAKVPLKIATSEMNTFGLAISAAPVEDYWTYTNRLIASSRQCSGDRLHWKRRDDRFPNQFDLFWVHLTSFSWQDYYPTIELDLVESHHFSRSKGHRLGDLPAELEKLDIVLIRTTSGETVTFLVRAASTKPVLDVLASMGMTERRTRAVDRARLRARWTAQPEIVYDC